MQYVLKQLVADLQESSHPVAKALHFQNQGCRILMIGFKKGMHLKEHKVNLPATLYVLQGAVVYIQNAFKKEVKALENIDIPINEMHAVDALEDSLCLLIQKEQL